MRDRLPPFLRPTYDVIDAALRDGGEHELGLLAPAIAYSLVLSLAPLTLALNLVGAEVIRVTEVLPGSPLEGTGLTAEELFGGALTWAGPLGSVVGALLVIFGAATLFGQLVNAITRIWRQGPAIGGWRPYLRGHLFALVLLLTAALGLFASAVLGNALAGLSRLLAEAGTLVGLDLSWLGQIVQSRVWFDLAFSAVLFTVAFATVPRLRPKIRDVLPGSVMTAAGYALGQWVLTLYLGSSARFTALGAYGAFLAFLVWAYYTATIVLWGAELTYQIAKRRACGRGGQDARPYECRPVAEA